MDINYEHLKTFAKVAEYKSFTQAAIELGTSQPAVTRLIGSLENQFGCKLFFRDKHSVTLTPEGNQLYMHVSVAVEQLEKGISTVAEFSNMEKGHLNISANEIGLRGSLDDLLGQFHEKYPNIMISLENMPSQESLKELSQGIMDFAFITSTVELHKPFRQVICKSFHDIPVIGSEFKIKNQSFQTLNDLQRVPYICMSKGHNTYDLYEEFFHDEGLRMNVDMFTNSFAMIMPMIEHGLGYAFMPDFIAEDSINTGKIFSPKIKEQMKPRNIRMIYDSTYPLSVAGKAFLDITLKYAKQHAMKAGR